MEEESPALRSIEAFFLNPSFLMESQKPASTTSRVASYSRAMNAHHNDNFKNDLAHERHTSTATTKNVVDEQIFWHVHTSDEEAASPTGLDALDELDAASFSDLPELTPTEEHKATVVSQSHRVCTHAQAITIHSAGRPRMVTVPKLNDPARLGRDSQFNSLPNQLRVRTPSTHLRSFSLDAPENERSSSDYSQNDSLDSSDVPSPPSTAPSSIHEQLPRPHRMSVSSKHVPLTEAARHVPLMEAVRLGSPSSPISPSSPAGMKSSYTWSQPAAPTSAPSIPRSSVSHIKSGVLSALINRFESSDSGPRRSSKPGSSNVGWLGKNILRRDTLEDIEGECVSRKAEPKRDFSQPASPAVRLPARSSTDKPVRMVARGANERAPVLTLPSCPDEFSRSFESEWPLWTESNPNSTRITTVA